MTMGTIISKEPIREFSGKILGYIETDSDGNQRLRDFYGKILGYYDAKRKDTTNFSGYAIARGVNIVTSLLK